MSEVIKVFVPQTVAAPRGALWAAAAVVWLVRALFAHPPKVRS
jgi:hypothetical protein